MKPLEYHPESIAESREAADWYWTRSPFAAVDFADEPESALTRLQNAPLICPPYLHGTRRVILDCFPFSVVFREHLYEIQIIAVAHASRRPGYWTKRITQ